MAEPFDVHTPSPDDGHEAIRAAVVQAIEDIDWNTVDVSVGFDLTDTLFVLLDGALADIATLKEQVTDLQSRLASLEAPPIIPEV